MDVLNSSLSRSAAGVRNDGFARLNQLKPTASATVKPTKWSDSLNAAVASRDAARPAAPGGGGINAAQVLALMPGHAPRVKPSVNGAQLPFPRAKPRAALAEPGLMESEKDGTLRQTAQTLVNQFFMGSMLKQMRDSPFKDPTLSGGRGGEAYASMFDQHIAEHAGNRIAKSLVGSMVKQYKRNAAGAQVDQLYAEPAAAAAPEVARVRQAEDAGFGRRRNEGVTSDRVGER